MKSVMQNVIMFCDSRACMSSVPTRPMAVVGGIDLDRIGIVGGLAVVDERHRAVAVDDFQQRLEAFGALERQEAVARQQAADRARQFHRALEFGDRGVDVADRQGREEREAIRMLARKFPKGRRC